MYVVVLATFRYLFLIINSAILFDIFQSFQSFQSFLRAQNFISELNTKITRPSDIWFDKIDTYRYK